MWRCTAPYVCKKCKVVHVTVHVDWLLGVGGGGGVKFPERNVFLYGDICVIL